MEAHGPSNGYKDSTLAKFTQYLQIG